MLVYYKIPFIFYLPLFFLLIIISHVIRIFYYFHLLSWGNGRGLFGVGYQVVHFYTTACMYIQGQVDPLVDVSSLRNGRG